MTHLMLRSKLTLASTDPFSVHVKEEVQIVELSFMSGSAQDDMEPSNLSFNQSDVSLSGLAAELGIVDPEDKVPTEENLNPVRTSTPPPISPLNLKASMSSLRRSMESIEERPIPLPRSRSASPFESPFSSRVASPILGRAGSPASRAGSPGLPMPMRAGSPLVFPSRVTSPLGIPSRVASPFQRNRGDSSASLNSLNGRSPRISREEVQRRLRKRSQESPTPEEIMDPASQETTKVPGASDSADVTLNIADDDLKDVRPPIGGHAMRREHPTYDGVISLDPEPQAIDPPRPSLPVRAMSVDAADPMSDFKGLDFDLPSGGPVIDLGMSDMDFDTEHVDIGEVRSALDRLVANVASSKGSERPVGKPRAKAKSGLVRVESVTEGVKAGQFEPPADLDILMDEDEEDEGDEDQNQDDRMDEDEGEDDDDEGEEDEDDDTQIYTHRPQQRSSPTPELLSGSKFVSPPSSRSASTSSLAPPLPPPPPPKDAIRTREQMIIEKRRELRRREEEETMGIATPPRHVNSIKRLAVEGRPSKRRSMSAGDAEDLEQARARELSGDPGRSERGLLDVVPLEAGEEVPLADSIARELRKSGGPSKGVCDFLVYHRLLLMINSHQKYHVREHEGTIYASSDADKVTHIGNVGDVDSGKAWRTVRRPSDMVCHLESFPAHVR